MYGTDAHVSGAYTVTAQQLAAWHERTSFGRARIVTSPYRSYPPTERMATCYYDGTFRVGSGAVLAPHAPGASPSPIGSAPPVTRLLVIVDGTGKASLLAWGPSTALSIEDPIRP